MTDSSAEEVKDKPYDAILKLLEALREEEARQRARIDSALPAHRPSAVNLSHYLALRRQDIRHLQLELGGLGLSSLGRCEGHVRDTLLRLHAWLSGEKQNINAH
jgi:pyruvate kinase